MFDVWSLSLSLSHSLSLSLPGMCLILAKCVYQYKEAVFILRGKEVAGNTITLCFCYSCMTDKFLKFHPLFISWYSTPCSIDPIHIDDPLFPTNNVGRNCFRIHQCIKVSCVLFGLVILIFSDIFNAYVITWCLSLASRYICLFLNFKTIVGWCRHFQKHILFWRMSLLLFPVVMVIYVQGPHIECFLKSSRVLIYHSDAYCMESCLPLKVILEFDIFFCFTFFLLIFLFYCGWWVWIDNFNRISLMLI